MLQRHIVSNRITSRMHYSNKAVIIICAFDSFGTVNISPTMLVTVLWHCRVVKSQLSSSPTLIVAYLALPSIIYHRWLVAGWVEPSLRPNAGGRLCYSMVSQCVASVFGCWHAMGNTAPTCLGALLPSIHWNLKGVISMFHRWMPLVYFTPSCITVNLSRTCGHPTEKTNSNPLRSEW